MSQNQVKQKRNIKYIKYTITTGIWKIPEIWSITIVEEDSEAPIIAWTGVRLEQLLSEAPVFPFIKPITAREEGSVKPHVSNIL